MDFDLSEDHLMLQQSVRDFALKEVAPGAESREHEGAMPKPLRAPIA